MRSRHCVYKTCRTNSRLWMKLYFFRVDSLLLIAVCMNSRKSLYTIRDWANLKLSSSFCIYSYFSDWSESQIESLWCLPGLSLDWRKSNFFLVHELSFSVSQCGLLFFTECHEGFTMTWKSLKIICFRTCDQLSSYSLPPTLVLV